MGFIVWGGEPRELLYQLYVQYAMPTCRSGGGVQKNVTNKIGPYVIIENASANHGNICVKEKWAIRRYRKILGPGFHPEREACLGKLAVLVPRSRKNKPK